MTFLNRLPGLDPSEGDQPASVPFDGTAHIGEPRYTPNDLHRLDGIFVFALGFAIGTILTGIAIVFGGLWQ